MNNYLYFENKLIDKNIEHNLEQYRCDDNRFRYIYKTTNLINGEYYKGQHTTKKEYITIFDHYYGSGSIFKKSLSKYGR